MAKYNPQAIEQKWQKIWPQERDSYKLTPGKEPYYCLDMFSYPSGEGLHMGHWRPYTIADVWSRYQTMMGKQVLHPIGFDSFGLPAENAAIKTQTPPAVHTKKAIANFTRQIKQMGIMYDWSTYIETSSPEYYRWTQWLFLQLYKNGLAYRKKALVNWCPKDQTVLANEQVIGGECERCGTEVVKKELNQWFLKITDFAEELLDFTQSKWPDRVKTLQTNWIGKSEGAEIDFSLENSDEKITVFTTRPDTLYGVTYLVVAPEHVLIQELVKENEKEIFDYIDQAKNKAEIDRIAEGKDKTGLFTGSYAIHPLTHEKLPIWVADYVVGSYGTGAVMGVPAHDQRDFLFAKRYNLSIKEVIIPETGIPQNDPEFRKSIVAIVRNPKTGELLTINWGDKGGRLFIGGGLEEGEDIVAAAKREIAEETGYTNLSYVTTSGPIHHNYFAHSKNKARRIEANGVLFDLVNDEQITAKLEEDETNQFAVEWMSPLKAETDIQDELHILVYRLLVKDECYDGHGTLINSQQFDGLSIAEGQNAIVDELHRQGKGRAKTTYRLRDWLVSRQRYWGAPIPIIYCEQCGEQPVPEGDLPVLLPDNAEFMPGGGSPLERHPLFKHTSCPQCGVAALRETDTLDVFVDSSWYFLRYTSPRNNEQAFDPEQVKTWLPVDMYYGGIEHAILHLLYARFMMKALYRLELVPYKEPFEEFYGVGMVYLNGSKMSKSRGNIVNPDEMVKKYGTDALRGYILFMGPADQDVEWQANGIIGVTRFLEKVWKIFQKVSNSEDSAIHPAIQQAYVTLNDLLPKQHYNRCISTLMIAANGLDNGKLNPTEAKVLCQLLAPFFPHFAEEVWHNLGNTESVFASIWPNIEVQNEAKVTYVVQVNGKLKATFETNATEDESEVVASVKQLPSVKTALENKNVVKTVFVSGRIVNFVVQ